MAATKDKCGVCSKSTELLVCGACKSVSYCSKDHQRIDWPKHKINCKSSNTTIGKSATSPEPPCFEVRPAGNKGLGLFATRNIKKGECILKESPLIVFDSVASFQKAFLCLSEEERKILFSLYDTNPNSGEPNSVEKALSINKTNAVSLEDNKDTSLGIKGGLFPIYSRINHSCVPNCNNYFNPNLEKETVHALRDINAGEEFLTSYIDLFYNRDERRKILLFKFKFTCECSACMSPEIEKSDKRRIEIKNIIDEIPSFANRSWRKVVGMVEKAAGLLSEENVDYFSSLYYDAFQSCAAFGQFQEAKNYAKKAYEAAVIYRGENSELAEKMIKLMNNPKLHPAWGLLARR